MSNGFYDYIANNTISFFRDKRFSLRSGERFCLKLDSDEMVSGVESALREKTCSQGIQGKYSFGDVYDTFTIKISDDIEVVIAAECNDMTENFLAKLRNTKLTEKGFPILILTHSSLDTIISGTGDLAAVGMPFHADSIKKRLEETIKSAQLSMSDTVLLEEELKLKQNDRYSDRSSLYEYQDILNVLGKGMVEEEDYVKFSLLSDPEGKVLVNREKIVERLKENRKRFERIDRVFKYGYIQEDLEKEYDKDLLQELQNRKKRGLPWHEGLTLDITKSSSDKLKRRLDHPLEIKEEELMIYSGSRLECSFLVGETAFIKSDGESKAKQRQKNILIYDSENHSEVTIVIPTNIYVNQKNIESENAKVSSFAREVKVDIHPENGCTFALVKLTDVTNRISYVFKICVLGLVSNYLDTIRTAYKFYVSKKKGKSKVQVSGFCGDFVVNPYQSMEKSDVAKQGGIYECEYNQTLHLDVREEEVDPDTGKLDFVLKCGLIEVPIQVIDDVVKPIVLTGPAALKKKYALKKSLEYRGGKIVCGTEPYYAKEPNKVFLDKEMAFLENNWLAAYAIGNKLEKKSLKVSASVRSAYLELLEGFRERGTVPSLAYYDEGLIKLAEEYIHAIEDTFENISQGKPLSATENDTLLIGCVIQSTEDCLIEMSPLHPLNVLYQLELLKMDGVEKVRDDLIDKLTPLYLLPYIRDEKRGIYRAIEQKHSPEWRLYASFNDSRFRGTRNFVQKLVCEKIGDYIKFFPFLFDDIKNSQMNINLVNMGDCREVFQGIVKYYLKEIRSGNNRLVSFCINIYEDGIYENVFSWLGDSKKVKNYLISEFGRDMEELNDLEQVLIRNVNCFYRKPSEQMYQYAHLTFYEMPLSEESGDSTMDSLNTGISLSGILSGVPSVLNSEWYKTGFGTKYAPNNRLTRLASQYNALQRVAFSGSSFEPKLSMFTEIKKGQEAQQGKIYDSSNWVVFVDPKVDLSFFRKNMIDEEDLMIIHYSDQSTSINGYDDITVTKKTTQYNDIIQEQLNKKGVLASKKEINDIINLFNAVNGSWMLRLITSKKLSGAVDSNFSREKMSILSAIKLCMAYYSHPNIVWIPISLEEMLRVSGGAGYSQKEGLLSARNLGFETQVASDDILMVGIEDASEGVKIHLHPVEVKIGINQANVISKAKTQVENTHKGLWAALWPDEGRDVLEAQMSRNFFMQHVIVCCEKMKLYGIYPDENWDLVTDVLREKLLNEQYSFSDELNDKIGYGTVVLFKSDVHAEAGILENNVCILEFPEKKGSSYMIMPTQEIESDLETMVKELPMRLVDLYKVNERTKCVEQIIENIVEDKEIIESDINEVEEGSIIPSEDEKSLETEETPYNGMKVLFGTDIADGTNIEWLPNDTNQVFHTNTGIIGTMGTGKTQFTKSMITQLYREQSNNVNGEGIGILIFDYKGDYNESKADFVAATNAKIYKPYHLPFNPLALTKSKVFKPILPIHTANAFKDTLSKIYKLGPKQENVLFQTIIDTYQACGINPSLPDTWDEEAPTFEQVYQRYMCDEEIKKNDSLAAAMDKLHQFQVFEGNPSNTKSLFEILSGVVVVDLSGYDADIQSLIVAITLDLFYSQMQASGSSKLQDQYRQLTKLILVDEADNFMSEGFPALKKILKEGREFGVGTILSTQFLKHFGSDDDDYSKYILTWVVHNVSDLKNSDVDFVFNSEPKSMESQRLFHDIKTLKKHYSIVKIGNNKPCHMRDKAFWELMKEEC